ncbi:threonine/serine exporter family protein [Algivirga pacifica]|uniref:Threonine/serine exporter family protein n=1 Tax=Algivirga pacifica TaxID=1162670 RepID=A0ABP9D4R6_9BACT
MWFNTLLAFISTLCFAFLFNVRGKYLYYAGGGGALAWLFYELGLLYSGSTIIGMFAGASMAAIYAEAVARVLRIPTTIIVISAIIPMVPGGGLYYTMVASIEGEFDLFMHKGTNAILEAGTIAISIVLVSSVFRIFTQYRLKRLEKKMKKKNAALRK